MVFKLGMDSRQLIARFEAERQAMALMDHPNVVKVFDIGDRAGRPFIVTQLVEGVPVTTCCDATQPTSRQRLQPFGSPPAVPFSMRTARDPASRRKAHERLVAEYDDRRFKLGDFGLALSLDQTLSEKTITRTWPAGTAAYIAPSRHWGPR